METFRIEFWVHTLYSYSLLTVDTVLIIYAIYQTQAIYRHQDMELTLAVALPGGANILE